MTHLSAEDSVVAIVRKMNGVCASFHAEPPLPAEITISMTTVCTILDIDLSKLPTQVTTVSLVLSIFKNVRTVVNYVSNIDYSSVMKSAISNVDWASVGMKVAQLVCKKQYYLAPLPDPIQNMVDVLCSLTSGNRGRVGGLVLTIKTKLELRLPTYLTTLLPRFSRIC